MDWLKQMFTYNYKGIPIVYSYGVFKDGLTAEELKNYLRVRLDKYDIPAQITKAYNDSCRGDTCPAVEVNGQLVGLFYRHDVERHADKAILGKKTYWD